MHEFVLLKLERSKTGGLWLRLERVPLENERGMGLVSALPATPDDTVSTLSVYRCGLRVDALC